MGEPVEVVREVYAAFGRGDMPAILEMIAADAVMDFPGPEDYPVFGRRAGRDGARAFFQAIGENEDIESFEISDLLPSGEAVLALGRVALKLRRNGAPVAYDWAHVWTVRDGRIAAFKGFTDTARIVEAWRR